MPPARDRALRIVELLARHPDGLVMSEIAEMLVLPKTAVHRLLGDLMHIGYVNHGQGDSRICLTIKLVSLALDYLASTGMMDVVQPYLDNLARHSGELARLAVVNHDQLIWVAKAQGARSGLRYEPGPSSVVNLAATATGQAWLATLPEERALHLIAEQGLAPMKDSAKQAPRSLQSALAQLHEVRTQGYAIACESNESDMSALAAPVFAANGIALGSVCITGPSFRFTESRMLELVPEIKRTAEALGHASAESAILSRGLA